MEFDRSQWRALRMSTPLKLTEEELVKLRGLGEKLDLLEVEEVYLPLARLIHLQVAARQRLFAATAEFLGEPQQNPDRPVPFIIGVAGSVAVGKSTTARVLQALLARWEHHPQVDLVTTDGFLYPNAELERRNLMHRKGFPESYDRRALMRFVTAVKSGAEYACAPVYSHLLYDIVPGAKQVVRHPDILILEGLNVLQTGPTLMVSDLFDFSLYVDARIEDIEQWYISRFLAMRTTAFANPASHFHHYARLNDQQAIAAAGKSGVRSTDPTWWRTSCPPGRGPRWCCARTPITPSTGSGCASCKPVRHGAGQRRPRRAGTQAGSRRTPKYCSIANNAV
ncbi:pantothenate kinase [Mycobacterium xenopi 4042]|uniref:Pantothenate kinase n=1 Tax=Mycobacterium xenopi 4042 TaxID=1299334 RepID=X8AG65_MYCXE|nr:pantothenate kinase [Mycobacterium xenopi 4042]